jgi:hypothetical protein
MLFLCASRVTSAMDHISYCGTRNGFSIIDIKPGLRAIKPGRFEQAAVGGGMLELKGLKGKQQSGIVRLRFAWLGGCYEQDQYEQSAGGFRPQADGRQL